MVKDEVNGLTQLGDRSLGLFLTLAKWTLLSPAIPSLTSTTWLVYMFQDDSLNGIVKTEKRKLVIDGKSIFIFQEQTPPYQWGDAGIKYVLESTGIFTTLEKGGSERVIISTIFPMFVMVMNHQNSLQIARNIFCTMNYLVPWTRSSMTMLA
ncbi:Glyceraldehyde-3-phosphate dehydrogenase [Galemys pyrenaicus]|uniref:Glyceraldehyde-3-phosphate dehydrogenase n=1 Tax=Galemys pyrenaicus TaxID=202257 RepID=A0A8J6A5H2_GALPY|nr:Glyceraldehyde-3-phosphate dehydrogenase [Galemys pyrenaicus]